MKTGSLNSYMYILLIMLFLTGCNERAGITEMPVNYYSVSGHVYEKINQFDYPLAEAEVSLDTLTYTTDSTGFFHFSKLRSDNYTLKINQKNYLSFEKSFPLRNDRTENCFLTHRRDQYFPNEPGVRYTYKISELTRTRRIDTVTFIVSGKTLMYNRLVSIWNKEFPQGYPAGYINDTLITFADSIVLAESDYQDFPEWLYLIPLEVNKSWFGHSPSYMGDTKVISLESVTVPAGYFPESYVIETTKSTSGVHDYYAEKQWFVPYVGAVRFEASYRDWAPSRFYIWELISYSL